VVRDDQPDAREGEAGRPGESRGSLYRMKPVSAGGGTGPQFKTNAYVVRDQEMGNLNNSGKCSETAEGVARESEAEAGYSFHRPCTDKISRETSWLMPTPQCAPTRAHRVWMDRTSRISSVWGAAMAWRTGACAQARDVPTGPHQQSVHTESQWQLRPWASRPCVIESA